MMRASKSAFAAFVLMGLVAASEIPAAPLANWAVDVESSGAGGASVVYSNLSTDSPVIGSGVIDSNNADSGIITSSFSTISLMDGQSITFSGDLTILGAKPSGEDIGFRFGLLFEPGTETNPVDTNGWLGYMADNSNAGQASGRLWARNTAGAAFETTTWISVGGSPGRGMAIDSEPPTGNGTFSDGTYRFSISIERSGADVIVSASILGSGETVFTNAFGPIAVSSPNLKTLDFNRAGLWSVSPLNADQMSFSGLDLTVADPPVPGDFNRDGLVDGVDFKAWQDNFSLDSNATLAQGDADGDGDVDGADFVVWQTNFPYASGASVGPVPEPTTLALVLGCVAGLTPFSRRLRMHRVASTNG